MAYGIAGLEFPGQEAGPFDVDCTLNIVDMTGAYQITDPLHVDRLLREDEMVYEERCIIFHAVMVATPHL